MNQLQTVLDALKHGIVEMNHAGLTRPCMPLHEAIAIVRQMMAQEPVARYIGECSEGSLVQLLDDVKKGTELFAAPQAVPAAPVAKLEIPEPKYMALLSCPWCSGTDRSVRPMRFGISQCNHDWHTAPPPAAPKGAV